MPTIEDAIAAWRNQQLNGTQLMRTLVSHQHWNIPVSETAAMEILASNSVPRIQFNKDPGGTSRLLLWSSGQTMSVWAKAAELPSEQHTLDTTGAWVFSLDLGNEIDEIWIDPMNPHDIFYKKSQFPALREFAAAVAIEKDIVDLRAAEASKEALVRIREYGNYLVPVARKTDGSAARVIYAPDDQGRTLLAAFTSGDTYDLYMPQATVNAGADELVAMQCGGKRLFEIVAGMNITGIVFNCSGPIRPIAFASGIAQVVLEA